MRVIRKDGPAYLVLPGSWAGLRKASYTVNIAAPSAGACNPAAPGYSRSPVKPVVKVTLAPRSSASSSPSMFGSPAHRQPPA